jgi:16S rRNA (uracil1498-N3)-methyltransferase
MNVFIALVEGNTGILNEEESFHCAKVLRKKTGDTVHLIDGKGNFYEGNLEVVSERKCIARISAGPRAQARRNYYLHLAVAPTKQIERIEWLVEKAVEIGVDEISFFIAKHSERKVLKTDRIRKISESAVKQSLQAFIPKVNEMISFEDLINSAKNDQMLIAHCFEHDRSPLQTIHFSEKSTIILIGPEGDFTQQELDTALKNNFEPVSLGQNRLRTETAALYACFTASLSA